MHARVVTKRNSELGEHVSDSTKKKEFRFSRIELQSPSRSNKSDLCLMTEQTARNKAMLATFVRLGDVKSDTRARVTMLLGCTSSITRSVIERRVSRPRFI